MNFMEQLEGRRLFSVESEVVAASGVSPSDIGHIHNPAHPYWLQVANRGLDIFNPTETARLFEANHLDAHGGAHGPVLAVGVETPNGDVHVAATGNSLA